MPYPIDTNAIVEVILEGRSDNQLTLSVFHYRYIGESAITDGAAALSAINTALTATGGFTDQYLSCCGTDFFLIGVSCQWITPTRYARADFPAGNDPGTAGGVSLPSLCSVACTKRSLQEVGRHAHGTLHMPGVPQAFVVNGVLSENGLTAYGAFAPLVAQNINTTDPAAELAPIIYQRAQPQSSVYVDECYPEYTVRTMKRRVVGQGV